MFYGWWYRNLMKLSHRFNWHYMPPCYPDGDTLLRCHWCGASYVSERHEYKPRISTGIGAQQSSRKEQA